MGLFDDVRLEWCGRQLVIPANKVLGAIARVEEVVTLQELIDHGGRGSVPVAKVSMAYGAVLRYAGAEVSDEDVYAGMFGEGAAQVAESVAALLMLLVPPGVGDKAKDAPPGNGAAAAAPASRPRTRRSSSRRGC
jgi:hypothetical protein